MSFPLPAGFSKTVICALKFWQMNNRINPETKNFKLSGVFILRLIFIIIVKQGAEWVSKVNLALTQTLPIT